jgi:hypothetical protein
MSLLRRRLLILAAMNNGLPNMPIRFKTGERAVFSDGKHGYFSMDRRFVRDMFLSRMYSKDGKRISVLKKRN